MDIWNVCDEIASKDNWYTKVFNDEIVNQWRLEIGQGNEGIFETALQLLRATAQGSEIKSDCPWASDDCGTPCDECIAEFKEIVMNNAEEYFGVPKDQLDDSYFQDGWWGDFDSIECECTKCECKAPHSLLREYIAYLPTGVLGPEMHAECKRVLTHLADNSPIDWHPGSDEKVRDIVHPSMYCCVAGVTQTKDGVIPNTPEEERYQWLPSDVTVTRDGVKFDSYINNLDSTEFPEVTPMVAKVFEAFVTELTHILPGFSGEGKLQVIVKIGSIHLTENNPQYGGGSWHIEGMPYEHIAATCIHYVDVANITPSFLEFRKPTVINEETSEYPQNDWNFTEHHYGVKDHYGGKMNRYLGLVACTEGASVVFPNSIQHRVKEFKLAPGSSQSTRMILAFFVIDPKHRIVSTADVTPQQGIMKHEDALFHRERLMYHRKFFVNQLNSEVFERPFSLCEH